MGISEGEKMKKIYFAIPVIAAFLVLTGVQPQKYFSAGKDRGSKTGMTGELTAKTVSENKKILVVYFSHTGTTREAANQIHQITGGDIFEIKAVKTYPADYEEAKKVAMKERDSGYKPELKTKVKDINSYDIIIIGYPIWWGTFPAPVRTFLSAYDFSGKTIMPFCTHGGSGLGHSVKDIAELCPNSTLLAGVSIRGSNVKTAQDEIVKWLSKNNIMK